MSDHHQTLLESAAEAIVFAHESAAAPLPPAITGVTRGELASLERTAALAAAALAFDSVRPDVDPPAPLSLQRRLAAAGLGYCAEQRSRFAPRPPGSTTARTQPGRRPMALLTSFALGAAAAGLAIWLGLLRPQTATMQQQAISLRDLRAQVLATEQNAVRIEWKPGSSSRTGNPQGDVVWSPTRQDGWLTFRGLPKLDPDHAYQLWIVDERRKGAPVDGGVFTIDNPADETLVPIRAKLPIGSPVAFVITIEDKAGVVVSDREHVVAIAGL